ncbi:tubulin binding cofactor A, partial [Rhodotorula diobovata]
MSSSTRQLGIKAGVVTRLAKDVTGYREEAHAQEDKVNQMEASGADEYELRAQRRILTEGQAMVPDAEQRLAKAVADLEDLVASVEDELSATD